MPERLPIMLASTKNVAVYGTMKSAGDKFITRSSMSDKSSGFNDDIVNCLRGLCMGAADIVPGVSGGTMALILGHYHRLVTAISHFDVHCVGLLMRRKFREAAEYTDLRFLVGLGGGIVVGIVALASLMHFLLENQQAYTYACFSGLILGSSLIVARSLSGWTWGAVFWLILGGYVAWQICVLEPMHSGLTPLTAFLAATVAICAMILPGISGAFVLLLLGLYHPITELIKGLPKGEVAMDGLFILSLFGLGCFVGLLSFSRILKWLLQHRHDATLACLCGLMIGSLYKIWPFQRVTEATAGLRFKEQRFDLVWPSDSPANLVAVFLLAALAFAATLGLEHVGRRISSNDSSRPAGE